jgi:hypothetical protein
MLDMALSLKSNKYPDVNLNLNYLYPMFFVFVVLFKLKYDK